MRGLLFLLFSIGIAAIPCPVGYTDGGDGSCYLWEETPKYVSRNVAYHFCSKDNACLSDISSSSAAADLIKKSPNTVTWLGLTCLKNSVDSCVWDNGMPMNSNSYHNFDGGSPIIQHGPCVYIDISTGKWHSADCSNVAAGYACKYTPNIDIPYCDFEDEYPNCGTFRGKCYRILDARNIQDAAFRCTAYNSVQTSIHSDGENAFISGLVIKYGGFYSLLLLGIQNDGTWVDGTILDYTNYDYIRPMDKCISLIVDDRGKWVTSPCSGVNAVTVCARESPIPVPTPPQDDNSKNVSTSSSPPESITVTIIPDEASIAPPTRAKLSPNYFGIHILIGMTTVFLFP